MGTDSSSAFDELVGRPVVECYIFKGDLVNLTNVSIKDQDYSILVTIFLPCEYFCRAVKQARASKLIVCNMYFGISPI